MLTNFIYFSSIYLDLQLVIFLLSTKKLKLVLNILKKILNFLEFKFRKENRKSLYTHDYVNI